MQALQGKVALITGANTGIGRAVALTFAAEGARVAIAWERDEAAAQSLAEAVQALGMDSLKAHTDVTVEDDVERLFEATRIELGPVDILVNNAGIQKSQALLDTSVQDFDRMLNVHLRGAFLCSRAAAGHMLPRGSGRIINVCSQLGYIGRANYTAYSTAKGGLIAFTRALARELAPHGILVNGVSPGLVDTGFDPLDASVKAAHAQSLPLGRLGTLDDVTSAFLFLAGESGRYYCGQMLHPNGGEIMP